MAIPLNNTWRKLGAVPSNWPGITASETKVVIEPSAQDAETFEIGSSSAGYMDMKWWGDATHYWRFDVGNVNAWTNLRLQIGDFATGAATTGGVLFSTDQDIWSDGQLSTMEAHGASDADLGSGYCTKVGRFRHVVNIGTHGDCAHETYGFMGQLVAREVTFKHLHAGIIGTLEGHTGGVISNGAYTYSVAAIMARVGGGAAITATKPISGFTAFWNGAALASGDSIAYSACASSTTPWKYGFVFPRSGVTIGGLIGSFASGGATTGGILFAATQDIWGDKQLTTFEVHGASDADLGSSYCAKVGRFRHLVNCTTAAHETYGLMGQLVVKDTTLTHLHAGIIGTLEGHTSGVVVNGSYYYGAAAIMARVGGGAAITATKDVCGFVAFLNGADVVSGLSVAYGVGDQGTAPWGVAFGVERATQLFDLPAAGTAPCSAQTTADYTFTKYVKVAVLVGGVQYYAILDTT